MSVESTDMTLKSLFRIPVEVGQTVWLIRDGEIEEAIVESATLKSGGLYYNLVGESFRESVYHRSLEEVVYFSFIEAKQKLETM
jgi:hypothetical protein